MNEPYFQVFLYKPFQTSNAVTLKRAAETFTFQDEIETLRLLLSLSVRTSLFSFRHIIYYTVYLELKEILVNHDTHMLISIKNVPFPESLNPLLTQGGSVRLILLITASLSTSMIVNFLCYRSSTVF